MLAAIGVGLHQGTEQARTMLAIERTFAPELDDSARTSVKDAWRRAVARATSRPSADAPLRGSSHNQE